METQKVHKIWILNGEGRTLPRACHQLDEYEFLILGGEESYPSDQPAAAIVLVEQAGDLELSEGFSLSPRGWGIPLILVLSAEMESSLEILPSHQGVLSLDSSPLIMRESLKTVLRNGGDEEPPMESPGSDTISEEYDIALENLSTGIVVHGADTAIVFNNPAAENILGLSTQTITGKNIRDPQWKFVDEKRRVLSPQEYPVSLVMSSQKALENRVFGILRPDRNYVTWVMVNALPVLNAAEEIYRVIVNFYDITEYKNKQDESGHSRKMEAIGQLAGGIAHDFNNMLTGIMSSADLIKTRLPRESVDNTYLDIILQSAQRAADLNSKLLSFAGRGKNSSFPVNIHNLLNSLVNEISKDLDKRTHINISRKARHHTISGDETQLRNAAYNLCVNAVQAMAYGGEISITTENVYLDESFCRYIPFKLSPGHYLSIEFKDHGEGIPQENLKKIFEPFFTTRPTGKGAGLGLASVYGTMEQHKGAVTVYSEPGIGSSFHLYLPLNGDQVLLHQDEEAVVKGAGTVLLVDDEEIIRFTAREMLESLEYKVLIAENGKDALDIYKERGDEIDLVILDMAMPVLDGMETFREIKALSPEARILLSSGFARTEDLEKMQEMGLLGYVKKPYRRADISRAVADALNAD